MAAATTAAAVTTGGGPAFYRPYYSFRPRVSLGFGLWMGYPVTYPYYDNPYGYANPYPADPYAYGSAAPSYGYPAQAPNYPPSAYPGYGSSGQGYPSQQSRPSVGVQRGGGQSSRGGISFEITPDTAAVFVDGTYVGTAGKFGPAAQPLDLPGGRRHVEIRASGYRTMTFDADVQVGASHPVSGHAAAELIDRSTRPPISRRGVSRKRGTAFYLGTTHGP